MPDTNIQALFRSYYPQVEEKGGVDFNGNGAIDAGEKIDTNGDGRRDEAEYWELFRRNFRNINQNMAVGVVPLMVDSVYSSDKFRADILTLVGPVAYRLMLNRIIETDVVSEQERYIGAFKSVGAVAVRFLRDLVLTEGSREQALAAVDILRKICMPATVNALVEILEKRAEDPVITPAVEKALKNLTDMYRCDAAKDGVIAGLAPLASGQSARVAVRAIKMLGQIDYQAKETDFVRFAGDSRLAIRDFAVETLIGFKSPATFAIFKRELGSEDSKCRVVAVRGLAKTGYPEAEEVMAEVAKKDTNVGVVYEIVDSLSRVVTGSKYIAFFAEFLESPNEKTRTCSRNYLSRHTNIDEVIRVLKKVAEGKGNPYSKAEAVKIIAEKSFNERLGNQQLDGEDEIAVTRKGILRDVLIKIAGDEEPTPSARAEAVTNLQNVLTYKGEYAILGSMWSLVRGKAPAEVKVKVFWYLYGASGIYGDPDTSKEIAELNKIFFPILMNENEEVMKGAVQLAIARCDKVGLQKFFKSKVAARTKMEFIRQATGIADAATRIWLLELMINDMDREVRLAAAQAILAKVDKSSIGVVIKLFNHKDAAVAEEAREALGGWRCREFLPEIKEGLTPFLKGEDFMLAKAAAGILGQYLERNDLTLEEKQEINDLLALFSAISVKVISVRFSGERGNDGTPMYYVTLEFSRVSKGAMKATAYIGGYGGYKQGGGNLKGKRTTCKMWLYDSASDAVAIFSDAKGNGIAESETFTVVKP